MIPLTAKLAEVSDGTFLRAVSEAYAAARAESPRREYLYYAEWEELFAIAERDGIIAHTRSQQFAHPLGAALLRFWREIRAARENAIPEAAIDDRLQSIFARERVGTASSSVAYRPREDAPNTIARRREQRREIADTLFTT